MAILSKWPAIGLLWSVWSEANVNETNITEFETIGEESKCMKMDLSDGSKLLAGMKALLEGLYVEYMVPQTHNRVKRTF